MSNARIIFFSILIAILLAVLILWCADVLAHGEGQCVTDWKGEVRLSSGGWVKIDRHLSGDELTRNGTVYEHGHVQQYYDRLGNTTHAATGYFAIDFDGEVSEWHVDCPSPMPSPPPPQRTPQPTTIQETSTESRSTDAPIAIVLERIISARDPDLSGEDETEPESEVDIEIPKPPELPVEKTLERWEVQFYKGWNLVSFPVLPSGVETIADLYHRWDFFSAHNADIFTLIDQNWVLYNGIGDGVAGEIPLSANLGLVVRLDWASWLGVRGVPLPNEGSVDLRPGVNLVGFADLPPGVKRPSDLLSDVICAVVVTRRGALYLIGRAGDSGDEPLERGQAVILVATEPTTLQLTSPTMDEDVSVRGWGAEKAGAN